MEAGYIYCVSEEVRPQDVLPNLTLGTTESRAWITQRDLRIKLISRIQPDPEENLTEEQAYHLKKEKSRPRGHESLAN